MQSNINIHLTSIQSLFSEYGIRNISMDDIAKNLHISKKTIYKRYTCKDELVIDIYINDYYRFKATIHSLERENNDAISKTIQLYNIAILKILSVKEHVHSDLVKYYPVFYNKLIELYKEAVSNKLIEVLSEGKADNYFNNNINTNSVAYLFKLLIESYVLDRISKSKGEYHLSCDDVFDYHFRSICNPVGLQIWEDLKSGELVSEQL